MKLVEELLESVRAFDCPVKQVHIGHYWIAVESRNTGLAHRYKEIRAFERNGSDGVSGSAFELAKGLRSKDLFEAGLGLAALNSLIEPSGRPGNIFSDIFGMIAGKTVTVVGRFPIIKDISELAGKLYVLETEPEEGELPAVACEEVIPRSNIVVISGSSLINKTLPRLLELSVAAKARAFVIGPSTPMSDILLQHGAYMLGGVRVTDTNELIENVKKGIKISEGPAGIEFVVMP